MNQIGVKNLTSAKFTSTIRAFKGPQALGAPSLQCGKYPTEPAACNDQTQFFQYQGSGQLQAHHRLPPTSDHLQARIAEDVVPPGGAATGGPAFLRGEPLDDMDWQQILLFAILGLGAGSLIAGIAIGVVLTYRGSGIINLATGAIAMLAGYSYWSLKTGEYGVHVATAPALVITFVFLLVIGLADRVRRVPAAADRRAAREARRLARACCSSRRRRSRSRSGSGRSRSRRCCRAARSACSARTYRSTGSSCRRSSSSPRSSCRWPTG